MADLWYPQAERRNGARSGPKIPKNRMDVCKMHYTVGVNSTAIGDRGYFTWLISRNGHVAQFAEVNNACYDSGEWNDAGPGIEFEYYEPNDGPKPENILTAEQIKSARDLIVWLSVHHGFPLNFYDGPRIPEFTGYHGFITHRSLQQTEQHFDYITPEQWGRIVTATPIQPPKMKGRPMATSFMLGKQLQAVWLDSKGRPKHEWYDPASKKWLGPVDMAPDHPEFKLDTGLALSVQTADTGAPNLVDVMGRGGDGSLVHLFTNPGKPWRSERFG